MSVAAMTVVAIDFMLESGDALAEGEDLGGGVLSRGAERAGTAQRWRQQRAAQVVQVAGKQCSVPERSCWVGRVCECT